MSKKRIVPVILAIAAAFALALPAVAGTINADGGTGSTPVELTSEAAVFSVTVPTNIPLHINADGTVTVPTDLKIINESAGRVRVTNVTVNAQDDWNLANYNGGDRSLLATEKVNSNKVGLMLKVAGKDASQMATATDEATQVISNETNIADWWMGVAGTDNATLGLDCGAIATAVSAAIADGSEMAVANVVFTVAWDNVAEETP